MSEPIQRSDPDPNSYKQFDQEQTYTNERGVVVLPVASTTSARRLIRLHGGYGLRKVKWSTSRVGSPPMLPAAVDTVDGDVLISESVSPNMPRPNQHGDGFDWRVTGEYTFVQVSPRVVGVNAIPAGYTPFVVEPQCDLATAAIGLSRIDNIANNHAVINKTDALASLAFQSATIRPDTGGVVWPFMFIPPECSSTHIIGG